MWGGQDDVSMWGGQDDVSMLLLTAAAAACFCFAAVAVAFAAAAKEHGDLLLVISATRRQHWEEISELVPFCFCSLLFAFAFALGSLLLLSG